RGRRQRPHGRRRSRLLIATRTGWGGHCRTTVPTPACMWCGRDTGTTGGVPVVVGRAADGHPTVEFRRADGGRRHTQRDRGGPHHWRARTSRGARKATYPAVVDDPCRYSRGVRGYRGRAWCRVGRVRGFRLAGTADPGDHLGCGRVGPVGSVGPRPHPTVSLPRQDVEPR